MKRNKELIKTEGELLVKLLEVNTTTGLSNDDKKLANFLISQLPETDGKCTLCVTSLSKTNKPEIGYIGMCRPHAYHCLYTQK